VRAAKLSPREQTVVELIAKGEALKTIAAACMISVQAVSTYLERAKRKLGVTSRPDLIRSLRGGGGVDVTFQRTHRLTIAEVEILAGILRGERNAQIARRRGRSVHTVAAQAATIMRKVGATSRSELVARAVGKRV
jgi:DNA-binding CsgD family transcriptional regulator